MSDLLKRWRPTRSDRWDLEKTGHLLRRASFGATLAERRRAVKRGVDRAVTELFESGRGENVDAAADMVADLGEADRLRSYRVWRLLSGRDRLRERGGRLQTRG